MKALVILSGGMDSAATLWWALKAGRYGRTYEEVRTLSFHYGQRHDRELGYAAQIARAAGVKHTTAQLAHLATLLAGSSQTSADIAVPHGHYEEESMKKTVVPNRNMVFLAVAVGHAISIGAERVFYGAHAGDHAIYPDCRPMFVDAMKAAVLACDWNPPELVAPFLHNTKAQVVSYGAEVGVPFELTYSCYEGQEQHCGQCGTCTERREAFKLAGVKDPTTYKA